MLNHKASTSQLRAALCASPLVGLALLLFHGQNANAQTCFPGVGANIGIQTPYSTLLNHCAGTPLSCQNVMVAHVGETITILGGQVSSSGSGCAVTNGQGWIVYPNNTIQKAIQDFSLQTGDAGGGNCICPGTCSPGGISTCLPFTQNDIVNTADINRHLS